MERIKKETSGIIGIKDFLLLLYLIIVIANASILTSEASFLYYGLLITFLIFLFTNGIKIDRFILIILIFWIFINFFSSIFNVSYFNFNLVIGYPIRFLISYFILKIIGNEFWKKFEKIIFFLTVLSSIIYLLNILFPSFFIELSEIFKPITAKIFTDRYLYYWNSIIYTHAFIGTDINSISYLRNSGFMWEPGAFSMIIIISIIYNWLIDGIKISHKIFIYIIVLITTFSTAGYLSLALLLIIYLFASKNYFAWVFIIVFATFGLTSLLQVDFLAPKINQLITDQNQGNAGYDKNKQIYEVNRYAAFLLKFYQFTKYPFGNGVVADKEVKGDVFRTDGVNGIGDILFRWGIVGIIFLFNSFIKFIRLLGDGFKKGWFVYLILISAITIVFFSNPIETNPILYLIVFTPYVFKAKNNQLAKKHNG
ncbi:MAG: hypothetical protein HXX18_03440 [Bacteroidetes bacterium]|nr:hypothetical protein [Bacteroidota bacterium]